MNGDYMVYILWAVFASVIAGILMGIKYWFGNAIFEVCTYAANYIWYSIFPETPLDTAKRIEKFVIDAYKTARKIAEDTHNSEVISIGKISKLKLKLIKCKNPAELEKIQMKIDITEKEYADRAIVSEISRTLVVKILQAREAVSEAIMRLNSLFKNNSTGVKTEDIKFLEEQSKKPKLFNEQVLQIIADTEFASLTRGRLIEAKQKLLIKTNAVSKVDPKDTEKMIKAVSEKDMAQNELETAEKESKEADDKAKQSVENIRELIMISLQLDSFVGLFREDIRNKSTEMVVRTGEGDIENLGSTEMTSVLDGSAKSKLLNIYEYYETVPCHLCEHLPTFRHYASKSNSILECGNGDMGVLWACLLGLAENLEPKPHLIYRGLYLAVDNDKRSAASELCQENNMIFNINDGYRIETTIYLDDIEKSYDLLIINSWYTYCQFKFALEKFAPIAKKYIILCCTSYHSNNDSISYTDPKYCGDFTEYPSSYDKDKRGTDFAIKEFLSDNSQWFISHKYRNNLGITILSKK